MKKEEKTSAQERDVRLPSYYALIPAKVRYDAELPPNAKLLYAEITALANAEGYCWASNGYLASIFKIAPRTVSNLIGCLEKRGHITAQVVRDTKTNQVLERRIWIDDKTPPEARELDTPIADFCDRGIAKNFHTPIAKNCAENNTSYEYIIPPISPMGEACVNTTHTADAAADPPAEAEPGKPVRRAKTDRGRRTVPAWKPERFAGLWAFYPAKGRKNKQRAVEAWDKLRPDDTLIAVIAKALVKLKASEEWQRGVGIPYVSTFLRGARWEDAEALDAPEGAPEASGGWAADEEVL